MVYLYNGISFRKSHAKAWMNLENMLRERSWAQKETNYVILFIQKCPEQVNPETEKKLTIAGVRVTREGRTRGEEVPKVREFLSKVKKTLYS